MAVVTDVDWLRHSMQMLGWMTPGEARLFSVDELDEAKVWAGRLRDQGVTMSNQNSNPSSSAMKSCRSALLVPFDGRGAALDLIGHRRDAEGWTSLRWSRSIVTVASASPAPS